MLKYSWSAPAFVFRSIDICIEVEKKIEQQLILIPKTLSDKLIIYILALHK